VFELFKKPSQMLATDFVAFWITHIDHFEGFLHMEKRGERFFLDPCKHSDKELNQGKVWFFVVFFFSLKLSLNYLLSLHI